MNRARGDTGFFQSRRKLKNGLFLIVLSGCLLMSGTVCEQVRIDRKRQEQTKLQYGQWEALVPDPDRDTRALLESHALLKSIGEQTVYGTFVMNPEDNARINGRSRPEETRNSYKKGMMRREETEFLIGWGNREFLEMEGLQLQSGRWPQSAEEAVVEEQVAYSLGMQAYPEQQLTGTLNDKPYTFRITGILRNSTESWTEGDRLASIFTGGRLEAASAETFLFLQGSKPGVIPDLRKAVPALIMNERSQYSWNPVSFADVPYTLLFAVSFLGEILAAVLFFWQWLERHGEGIGVMRLLGISPATLQRDFRRMFFKTAGSASGIVLILSLLLRLPAGLWLFCAGVFAAAAVIIQEICAAMICRVKPALNQVGRQELRHLPKRSVKDLSAGSLASRFLSVHCGPILLYQVTVSILAGILLFLCLSFAGIQVTSAQLEHSYDFVVTAGYNETIPSSSLTHMMTAASGKSRTSLWYQNYSGWQMEIQDREKLEAMYNLPGQNPDAFPGEDAPEEEQRRIRVPVLSGNEFDGILKQVEDFRADAWETGQGALLVLPTASDWEPGTAPEDEEGNIPDPLVVGDSVTMIDPDGEKKEIVIAGILRSPVPGGMNQNVQNFHLPFGGLLVSPAFLKQAVTDFGVLCPDGENSASIRASLAAAAWQAGLRLENNSVQKQASLSLLKQQELMLTVLAALVLGLILLICHLSGSFTEKCLTDYSSHLSRAGVLPVQIQSIRKKVVNRLLLMSGIGTLTACMVSLEFHFCRIAGQGRIRLSPDHSSHSVYLDLNKWLLSRVDQGTALCIVPFLVGGICGLYWLALRGRKNRHSR
ncbi:hypothetical protein [Faecalibaculum rodentium]|uniref:hypothetical protein n=2 Tax=Faecalibaculum rodentium TaxID=1702221 RepID=UPI0026F11CCC|nr:hypothetical protein [Faecalibaculum rodentium]